MLLLDHIVFLVKDLDKAVKDFQAAGYIVSKGGKHDNGITQNALIHFENGTFLELLALQKSWRVFLVKWLIKIPQFRLDVLDNPFPETGTRFMMRALLCKEGIIDFCLLANNGLADYEEIKCRDLLLTIHTEMKRKRPDGLELKWNVFAPLAHNLPFAMTPYQPTFKPPSENLKHPNGAKGFEKVKVYVNDLENCVLQYEALLGAPPVEETETYALFQLQRGQIEVINSDKRTTTGIGFLEMDLQLRVKSY